MVLREGDEMTPAEEFVAAVRAALESVNRNVIGPYGALETIEGALADYDKALAEDSE